jgi:hypothetical protein
MIKTVFPSGLYKRKQYLEQIKPFIDQNIIKVITGQRRVGKSYFLFQIIDVILKKNKTANIIYINKEDLAFSSIKDAKDLNDYVKKNLKVRKQNYVFIDEIQEIEAFEDALRSLLLIKNIDLYCTGSNANLLSGDIAGKLSGRSIELKIYSLSYKEFIEFHNMDDSDKSLDMYLKYGGLPYLKNLPLEDVVVFEYLKNIYTSIVFRDIINRNHVRNTVFLEQLIFFIADNVGSLFSAKKISDFLKSQKINLAPNQVQSYLQFIANAFIIHKVNRYDIIGKRIFEIGEKYYFENLGLRHSIWGYRLEDRAKILENAVYNHLLFKGYKVYVGKINQLEIDFIAEKDNEIAYYQVALTINDIKTLNREIKSLEEIPDNYPKTLITYEAFKGKSIRGIKNIDLSTFLLS